MQETRIYSQNGVLRNITGIQPYGDICTSTYVFLAFTLKAGPYGGSNLGLRVNSNSIWTFFIWRRPLVQS